MKGTHVYYTCTWEPVAWPSSLSLAARPPGIEASSWRCCPFSDPRVICHLLRGGCPGAADDPGPGREVGPPAVRGWGIGGGTPGIAVLLGPTLLPLGHLFPTPRPSFPLRGDQSTTAAAPARRPASPARPPPPAQGNSGEPGAAAVGVGAESAPPPRYPPPPACAAFPRPPAPGSRRALPQGDGFKPRLPGRTPGRPRQQRAPHSGRGRDPSGCGQALRHPRLPRDLLLILQAGIEASHGSSEPLRHPGAGAAGMSAGQLGSQGSARTAHARGPVHKPR